MKKSFFWGSLIALLLFFFSSMHVKTAMAPDLRGLPLPSIRFGGVAELQAGTSYNAAWEYVRGTATFARAVQSGLTTLINALKASGALSYSGTYQNPATSDGYKLEWKGATSDTVSGPLGSVTYEQHLYLWKSNNDKAFELFLKKDGSGAYIKSMPARTGDSTCGSNTRYECQVTGTAGSRTMLCQISGAACGASPPWSGAMVKVAESGSQIKITALSRTTDGVTGTQCAGGNQDYFPLAYIISNGSPYQTTAKFGYNDNSIAVTACGIANAYNYGLFSQSSSNDSGNSKYFVEDGVAGGSIPAGYPVASDVDTLFNTIGTGELTKAQIDTLTTTAATVDFFSSAAPSF